MAKTTTRVRSGVEFNITLDNIDEAQYLYAVLLLTNPVDAKWELLGGDPLYRGVREALEDQGVDVDSFEASDWAEVG